MYLLRRAAYDAAATGEKFLLIQINHLAKPWHECVKSMIIGY
jgi:hypothetical protein